MTRALRIRLTGIIVAMLMTASAAVLGFAHRAPSAEDEAIAVAALTGKIVSDICAGSRGDLHGLQNCGACHIGDGPALAPPPGIVADAGLWLVAEVTAPRENRIVRPIRDPAHGLRAPPAV